jgi:hypothetical protein
MSMISPIPFWPSLLPCAKLTAVQVPISSARIPRGGGVLLSGASNSLRSVEKAFITSSISSAPTKPTTGLNASAESTLVTCAMSTPDVPSAPPLISWLASPTPRIEPIRAWLDELGSPTAQVARFHRIAASSSAKIIANPPALPTLRIRSTGSSVMIE